MSLLLPVPDMVQGVEWPFEIPIRTSYRPSRKTGLEARTDSEDEIADFIEMIETEAKNRIAVLHARFPTVGATFLRVWIASR